MTTPSDVRAEIRAAPAVCDTDTAVAAIEQMRAAGYPGWADRIEREFVAAGLAKLRAGGAS